MKKETLNTINEIKILQRNLIGLGYYPSSISGEKSICGIYGSVTKRAVENFQKDHMNNYNGNNYFSFYEETSRHGIADVTTKYIIGDLIKGIQSKLKELDYNIQIISSVYDNHTERAVKAFQEKVMKGQVSELGILDKATIEAIRRFNNNLGMPTNVKTFVGGTKFKVTFNKGENAVKTFITADWINGIKEIDGEAFDYLTLKYSLKNKLENNKTYSFRLMSKGPNNEVSMESEEYSFTTFGPVYIKYNDKNSKVNILQRDLTELGYYDAPIGAVFGDATKDAVRALQRDIEHYDDGMVYMETLKAIEDLLVKKGYAFSEAILDQNGRVIREASKGFYVEKLKKMLKEWFKYDNIDITNGVYDAETKEAVSDFQSEYLSYYNDYYKETGKVGIADPTIRERIEEKYEYYKKPLGNRNLNRGCKGYDVRDLQKMINAIANSQYAITNYPNYDQLIDFGDDKEGVFGNGTEQAIIKFQTVHSQECEKEPKGEAWKDYSIALIKGVYNKLFPKRSYWGSPKGGMWISNRWNYDEANTYFYSHKVNCLDVDDRCYAILYIPRNEANAFLDANKKSIWEEYKDYVDASLFGNIAGIMLGKTCKKIPIDNSNPTFLAMVETAEFLSASKVACDILLSMNEVDKQMETVLRKNPKCGVAIKYYVKVFDDCINTTEILLTSAVCVPWSNNIISDPSKNNTGYFKREVTKDTIKKYANTIKRKELDILG